MASVIDMVGSYLVNAASFIDGNYLAQYLSGGDKAEQDENKRHDEALEAYQAAYARYLKDWTALLDWIATNCRMNDQAKKNFANTDYGFKLYRQAHADSQMKMPKERRFQNINQPSEAQTKRELLLVGAGALAIGYAAFRFLYGGPRIRKD